MRPKFYVGIYKKKTSDNTYDDIQNFTSYDDAWEYALDKNLRGFYVEIGDNNDSEVYKPREMGKFVYSEFDEAYNNAPLMNIRNQLMNKLGDDFTVTGGTTVPKVIVTSLDKPDISFDIVTDGKNVEITPKKDGVPDTLHKKRGIAFMRAANILYDFIMQRAVFAMESAKKQIKLKIKE